MTMVIMTFVVIGLFSYSRLGVDLMPKIDFPFVSITAVYPGAGPEEVETLIAKPMEEEVSGISGLKNLYSVSQEGYCLLFAELNLGEDVDIRSIDIKDKIDAIRRNLPDDMQDPVIQKFRMGSMPIFNLSVLSDMPLEDLNDVVEDVIKPELSKISGIANIQILGQKERQIEIALSAQKLRAYQVSPLQVVAALGSENMNLPSGRIERGKQEYTLRMSGEYLSIDEIAGAQIQTPQGRIRLDRLGKVRDTFSEQREMARFNGQSSISVDIVKQEDANTVQVGQRVRRTLDRLDKMLPENVELKVGRDNSVFIEDAVKDVFNNLVMGILCTAAVLFLFLHSWRGTVIAALTMPISVVSTFTLLMAAGFTMNFMSLMGLAVSVGILVVNAVVVLENIERLRKEGMDTYTAAKEGAGQIALAVAASTLTNIVVFTPMAFMQGMIGPIFMQFGLTVTFATIFSLLIAFTLTPMMASRPISKGVYGIVGLVTLWGVWKYVGLTAVWICAAIVILLLIAQKMGGVARFARAWDRLFDDFTNDYRRFLDWVIHHRKTTLGLVTLLFLFGLFLFKFIGAEFFPTSDERSLGIFIEMPAGTRLEETNRVLTEVEATLQQYPEVDKIVTKLGQNEVAGLGGGQGVQYGMARAELKEREPEGYSSTEDLIKKLRLDLADIPAAKIIIQSTSQFGGGGAGAAIELQIQGENIDELVAASEKTIELISETGKAVDVRSDWQIGKPEIIVEPNRGKLFDRGGTVQDVAMVLRTNFEGLTATTYREGGDEFDVAVRLLESDRNSVERVGDLLIPLRSGFVPLKDVTDITVGSGPTKISRKNKQRMVTVSMNVATGTMGDLQKTINETLELPATPPSQQMKDILSGVSSAIPVHSPELPAGVTVYYGGEAEMMAESFSSLLQALVLAVILTYMLLAALLDSYKHPFIIMMTLPMALIGVAMALVMSGKSISMISLMAIVMLVGIVVNNAILLIDYVKELRGKGKGLDEAVLEACPVRLRPIIMSTLATVLGMLPLALGLGAAGEMRSPMAVVTIGGLISATVLTLVLIPALYVMMEVKGEIKN